MNSRLILFITLSVLAVLSSCLPSRKSGKSINTGTEVFTKEQLEENHYFMGATREKLLGNYSESVRLYKKALQINPHNAAAAYELGILALNSKEMVVALQYSQIAYREHPENSWYALLHAEVLQRNGKFSQANSVYEKLIKQLPYKDELYYDYADCLMRTNKTSDAIEVLDKLEKIKGIQEESTLQKERIYIKAGKFEKAAAEVKKLIDAYPSQARYMAILAELYAANNQTDMAKQYFDQALQAEPNNAIVNLSVSEYYRQKREYKNALPPLQVAFLSEELDIDTKIKILLTYYLISENDSTLKEPVKKLCTALRETHPSDPKAYSISGDFALRDKDLKGAREYYIKTLDFDKSKFVVWSQLLLVESDLQDFDGMEKHAREASELFPNEPSVFLLYGIALLQNKKPSESIPVLQTGLNLIVDNKALKGQILANLGDAYYRNKQMEKSDEYYEKALELNPKDTYVLNNYAYYLSLRNENLPKAAEMSRKTIELDPDNSSYLDTYGWILYMQGKYEEAKGYLEKAINSGSGASAVVLEHYGDVLYRLKNTDQAFEYWQKAKNAGTGSDYLEKKIQEKKLIE